MSKRAGVIPFTIVYIIAVLSFVSRLYIPAAVLLCILCLTAFVFFKNVPRKLILSLFAAFLIGSLNTALHIKYDDDLSAYSNSDVTLNLIVKSIPTNNLKDKTKFYAKVLSVETPEDKSIPLNAQTYVNLSDKEENFKNIKLGDNLQVTGRVKFVDNAQNPYQFDYAAYLHHKNVFTVFYAENDWIIKSRASGFTGKLIGKLNDTRTKILSVHAKYIKSPGLEILGGIIFGNDAVNPDEDTKKSFINSGIYHILAASGMNVTLIFGIWFFFAIRLRLNYRFSIIAGMLLILFYTCMTGFGPPIIRAYLMLTLILAGKLFDRKTSTLSLLFFVALLMLVYNPFMLFDLGFRLSFIITFALILTAPLIEFKFKHKFINVIAGSCLIPVIAQLYAFPLQMYYFNTFTVYSVFANIAIISVLSLVSFIGFVASVIAVVPVFADKVCFVADFVLNPMLTYIVKVAEFFSGLPGAIIYLKKPSLIQVFAYFTVIVFLTCILRYKLSSKKVLYSFFFCLIVFGATFISFPKKNTEIIFFSVGNADAILIKTETNKYFLTDTARLPYMSSLSMAETIVLNYLRNKGVKEIEALILSHFDADHAGGTLSVLQNIKVNKLYMTDSYENTMLFSDINSYINKNNVNYEIITGPEIIYSDKNTEITLIRTQNEKLKTENQKSIVLHLKYNNYNVLLLGDGDIETYNTLDKAYKENVFVMKSGHHGAKNTVNDEMASNTEIFVISTGFNIYGHPAPEVLDVIKRNNKTYYRTDYHNAVKVVFNKSGCKIYSYSPLKGRFVPVG